MNTKRRAADWNPSPDPSVDARAKQYADLRGRCPVPFAHVGWSLSGFWSLLRHSDIAAAVRNPKAFTNGKLARMHIRRPPLESDPPEHTQFRRLLNPLFAPAAMAAREPLTRAIALECLQPLLDGKGGDAIELVARPFPPQVLLSWLGCPRKDWVTVKALCDGCRPQRTNDPAARAAITAAETALWDYSHALVAERRRRPLDPESDPVTALLQGQIDGKPIDPDLIAGVVRLVLAAGHDSTSQAVGICIGYLAAHPEHQDRLRAEPSLIPTAIEEILRLESPVVAMPRIAAEDVELHGRRIAAGDHVMLNWASANRDPAVFTDPDRCVLDRKPNPHMVFGHGIHTCLGAPLARQEIRVVLEKLLARTTSFALAGAPTVQDMSQYGFATLPLSLR